MKKSSTSPNETSEKKRKPWRRNVFLLILAILLFSAVAKEFYPTGDKAKRELKPLLQKS